MAQLMMKKCWSCNSEVVITSVQCPFCKERLGLVGKDGVAAKGMAPTGFGALIELIAPPLKKGWSKLRPVQKFIVVFICLSPLLPVLSFLVTFQNDRYRAEVAREDAKAAIVQAAAAKVEAQRLAAIEAAKTPEQRASEAAAKQKAIEAAAKEHTRIEAAREKYNKLFSELDFAIMESERAASEMAETNTTNGYFRKRDNELRSSRDKAARSAARILTILHRYRDGEPDSFDRLLFDTIFNASDSCDCTSKAAKAWMSYFDTLDRQDRDSALTYINFARAAESRYDSGKAQVLAQAGTAK